MKNTLITLLVLLCVNTSLYAQEKVQSTVVGDWAGVLDVGSAKLKLLIHIKQGADGAYTGTMDSVTQGALGLKIDTIKFEGNTLSFELKQISGSYIGTLNAEGNELSGDWKQMMTLPLKFKRATDADLAPPKRPQEPVPPYPYVEEEIVFDNKVAGIKLAGTLTLPPSKGLHPAVILISGSGPQNRNEELMGHKPFWVLADHLTRQGIAVLRFDDRGFGKSTGDFSKATSVDFASDVLHAIEYLKTRKDIALNKIGLIGHSEGGVVAPMVTVESKDVSFIILMAGTGVNGEEIMYEQNRLILKLSNVSDELIDVQVKVLKRLFNVIKQEKNLDTADKLMRSALTDLSSEIPAETLQKLGGVKAFEASISRLNSVWFRYFLLHDPRTSLRQIKVPVLALNGELDVQVSPKQNLPAIESALKQAGNQKVKIVELPKLNHLFQTAKTGAFTEYSQIEETISPAALNTISDWVKSIVF